MLAPDIPLWPDTVADFYARNAHARSVPPTLARPGATPTRSSSAVTPPRHCGTSPRTTSSPFSPSRTTPGPGGHQPRCEAYRVCLQSIFGWAHTRPTEVATDPTEGITRRVRIRPGRVRSSPWLTETQITALLTTSRGQPVRRTHADHIVLMLGIFTGLRARRDQRPALAPRRPGGRVAQAFLARADDPDRLPLPPQPSRRSRPLAGPRDRAM